MTLRGPAIYLLSESEHHGTCDWPGDRVIGPAASLESAQDKARRSLKMTSQPFGMWIEEIPGRRWRRVVGTAGEYQVIQLYPVEP